MSLCLIGLGSNVGNRRQTLVEAVARLARHPQVQIARQSPLLETSPVGGPPGQTPYLNGAVLVETSLAPQALLEVAQAIEIQLGRQRQERWGPRTVDLDLLLYDRLVLATPALVLPHPRMAWRRFVLEGAAQIAGEMVHPVIDWSIQRLLEHLDTSAYYVAITGSIGAGKTRLARQVAERTNARLLAEQPNFPQLGAFYRDPTGHAWQIELEFVDGRARSLAAQRPEWREDRRPTVSDFWFDQSAAFARVWLRPEQWEAYCARWEQACHGVVRPRLVVLIEVGTEELLRRILSRGRQCEAGLTREQLDRISRSVVEQASRPHQGPLLRLTDSDSQTAMDEVLAAMESMK